MRFERITYQSPAYQEMLELRSLILRTPLGLKFSSADIEREANDFFCVCRDDEEKIIGCCVLTKVNESTLQLRQMAVDTACQGQKIGEKVLSFAEQTAREQGYTTMILHARLTARGFYAKYGYKEQGSIFTEVTIPHIEMSKQLS